LNTGIPGLLGALIFGILFLAVVIILDKNNFNIDIRYLIIIAVVSLIIQIWEILSNGITDYQSSLWLQFYLTNQHPYGLYGSFALPAFYFILVPFYILGNTVLSDSLGFLILFILIFKFAGKNKETTLKTIIFLLSPLAFYGIIYFSGRILLSTSFIVFIFMSNKAINNEKYNLTDILVAILFGILMSSFFELGIVTIIYFLYRYKNDIREFSFSIIISSIVFFLTLLPFLISRNGLEQSSNLFSSSIFLYVFPWWSIIFIILLTYYIGWIITDLQEMFFSFGIILFVIFIIEFITMDGAGEVTSNFLIAIPFLIFSVKNYRVDKFIGKVFG
jgi:hypothetical protein